MTAKTASAVTTRTPLWAVCSADSMSWFGFILCVAIGVVSTAFALARATDASVELLFWFGIAIIFIPALLRVCRLSTTRNECIALIVTATLAMYFVKVLQNPFAFTFADEYPHQYNDQQILLTHHLFGTNPILPITNKFPGIEEVSASLGALTGASSFATGLITVGVARLLMSGALFLFFERISGSFRTAAIASFVYCGAPNYVFFSAEFSYESLALPLAVTAGWLAAEALPSTRRSALPWLLAFVIVSVAIIPTHHLTSYALVVYLLAVCTVFLMFKGFRRQMAPLWASTLLFTSLTVAWLVAVAPQVVNYLAPLFTSAVRGAYQTITLETPSRTLFTSGSDFYPVTPIYEKALAVGSVLILMIGVPVGIFLARRQFRKNPTYLVLALGALGYMPLLGLRLASSGVEIATRSSEFLYIAIALFLSMSITLVWLKFNGNLIAQTIVGACAAVFIAGGLVIGWPPALYLPEVYRIHASSVTFDAQPVTAAQWAQSNLGPDNRFGAEAADGRALLIQGSQIPVINPDISLFLYANNGPPVEPYIKVNRLRYAEVDLRRSGADPLVGYFFPRSNSSFSVERPQSSFNKLTRYRAGRLFDSGDIQIYDLRSVAP